MHVTMLMSYIVIRFDLTDTISHPCDVTEAYELKGQELMERVKSNLVTIHPSILMNSFCHLIRADKKASLSNANYLRSKGQNFKCAFVLI